MVSGTWQEWRLWRNQSSYGEDDLPIGAGGNEDSEHWAEGVHRLMARPYSESATADVDVDIRADTVKSCACGVASPPRDVEAKIC